MKDRNGQEIDIGDWIIYVPIFQNYPREIKRYMFEVVGIESQWFGAKESARVSNGKFTYNFSEAFVEKLPRDEKERQHVLLLKMLEL